VQEVGVTPDRIVILNDTALARGGAAALALLSAREFRARGLPVTWLSGDPGDNPELTKMGIEVHGAGGLELLAQGRLRALRQGIHNHASAEMVARFIVASDTPRTIYHVHAWALIHSPSIFGALAPVARRTFVHAHDAFAACPNGVYYDFGRGRPCTLDPLGSACILTNCDKRSYAQKLWRVGRHAQLRRKFPPGGPWAGLILIHPLQRNLMRRAGYPDAVQRVVLNPVTPFSETRIPAEANRSALFVGRIEPDKGVGDLVVAAAKNGIKLTIVGDGPLRDPLARAHPDVTFTGWLDPEAVAHHARQARFLVMPSRFPEPFGMVAAEASQGGLPVVVPRTAFLADQIVSGGLGLVYDPSELGGLGGSLRAAAALSDADIAEISSRAFSRQTKLANTPADWADALLALYADALQSTDRRAASVA
jgi:glycosyltransferase involved in cell wall biosynthesis